MTIFWTKYNQYSLLLIILIFLIFSHFLAHDEYRLNQSTVLNTKIKIIYILLCMYFGVMQNRSTNLLQVVDSMSLYDRVMCIFKWSLCFLIKIRYSCSFDQPISFNKRCFYKQTHTQYKDIILHTLAILFVKFSFEFHWSEGQTKLTIVSVYTHTLTQSIYCLAINVLLLRSCFNERKRDRAKEQKIKWRKIIHVEVAFISCFKV